MTSLLAFLAALGLAAHVAAQTPAPAAAPEARSAQIQTLQNFQGIAGFMNLARGCVRIVAVASPSAPGADAQLDTILSVVRTNPSKRLRMYVILTPGVDTDTPLQAAIFASRHPADRVVYLWDPTSGVANLWKESVGIKAADRRASFYLYDTAAIFTLAPPTPDAWVQASDQARFDAHAFTDRAGELVRRVESKVAGAPARSP